MIGAIAKAVKTVAATASEINKAKKFLESYGFKLPKDYRSQIKAMQIAPDGGSRLGQIKTGLARMSSIKVGRRSAGSQIVEFRGDDAVSVLRAIEAENMRRSSATRIKPQGKIRLVPSGKTPGAMVAYGTERKQTDIPRMYFDRSLTYQEALEKVKKSADVTTAQQEMYNRAEGFRSNLIKGYINGAAGPELEKLVIGKINGMSNWEMQMMALDMQQGKIRNVMSIDDIYEGVGGNHIGAIIGFLDAFGIGFDDLNDSQKNEIAILTGTPYGVNDDGTYDWHNVEDAFNRY